MSGIGGYYIVDAPPAEHAALQEMADSISHRGPDGSGLWQAEKVGLCNCILHTTPESLHEKLPLYEPGSELTLVVDGRIDNRKELIDTLGIPHVSSAPTTDSSIILSAYKKWQEGCAVKLLGDFAFAIWDGRHHTLFCCRDHMGVKPFFYYWDGSFFAFCSEIKGLFALLGKRPEINQQRVLDLLVFYYSDPKSTFYTNIYRLPKASSLRITQGALRESSYYSFDPDKRIVLSSDEEYAEAFQEIFRESVRCRLRSHFPIGSTLSGGLDSSSIVCMARKVLKGSGERLHTFSAIFPGLSAEELKLVDERKYMDAVIDGGGVVPHFIEADKLNPLEFLGRQHHEEVMPAFNMYIFDAMYKNAQENNVRVFLDGEGGDTIVSYGYDRLYDLGMQCNFTELVSEARAVARYSKRSLSLYQIIKEYVIKPRLSERVIRLLACCGLHSAEQLAVPDISILNSSAKELCDWEKRALDIDGHTLPLGESGHRKHCAALLSPFLQYVMESIDTVAGKYPLECRYPFLDRRLMEFCLGIPVEQKMSGGMSRLGLRRAMSNIIPYEVANRLGKSDLSPNFDRHLKSGAESIYKDYVHEHSEVARYLDIESLLVKKDAFIRGTASSQDGISLYIVAALGQWIAATRGVENR